MSAIDVLLARLAGVRKSKPNAWMSKCPAHDDSSPSLAITYVEDGRILIHCFAGCEAGDVLTAVGMSMRDLFPEALAHHLPQRRLGVSGFDVVNAMRHETTVLAMIAQEIGKGRVDEESRERAKLAADRIQTALSLCDG